MVKSGFAALCLVLLFLIAGIDGKALADGGGFTPGPGLTLTSPILTTPTINGGAMNGTITGAPYFSGGPTIIGGTLISPTISGATISGTFSIGSLGVTGNASFGAGIKSTALANAPMLGTDVSGNFRAITLGTGLSFGGDGVTLNVTAPPPPITWPAPNSLIISNGTNSPSGLSPVNNSLLYGNANAWVGLAAAASSVPCWNASSMLSACSSATMQAILGYLTANQTITLSGDFSGSGTTAINGNVIKVNGVAYPFTPPATNTIPYISASNQASYGNAATILGVLGVPFSVPSGGSGLATLTAGAIYKGAGTANIVASGLSDSGSVISTSEPFDLTNQSQVIEIANASSVGTTNGLLAKLTGAPSTALTLLTSDTDGALGVVLSGGGTIGNALIVIGGQANCSFDGATTADNWVIPSSTAAGKCHDTGSATRPGGSQVIGRVLTTNAGGPGSYAMIVNPSFTNTAGSPPTWPATGSIVVSNTTNTPAGLAPVNNDLVYGTGGAWAALASAANSVLCTNGSSVPSLCSAATTLSLLGAPWSVSNGGWGLTTLTSGAIYRGNGTSPPAVSGLSDNGTFVSTSEPFDLTTKSAVLEVANAGSGGTTVGLIAKISAAPSTALTVLTSDTDGAAGIVIGGGGTTGNAQIAFRGRAFCTFDGGTTASHYVSISGSVPGNCHDFGAARPAGVQSIGQVLTTNASGGSYEVAISLGFTNTAGSPPTWPATGDIVVSNSTNTPAGLAPVASSVPCWNASSVLSACTSAAAQTILGYLTSNQTITLGGDAAGSGTTSITVSNLKLNGVAYPASPATNTVPVVTTSNQVTYETGAGLAALTGFGTMLTQNASAVAITGGSIIGTTINGPSNTITNIGNASLTNSSMTLAGHSVSLGGTQAFAIGDLSNIGATTIVGNNTGISGVPLALSTAQVSTMLGLGTMASQNASAVAITGGSIIGTTINGPSNTITNIANASLTNSSMTLAGHVVALGGTQAFAIGDLSTIAASTIVGNNTVGTGVPLALSTAQVSTMLGLGTMATQNASAVAITGGSLAGTTISGSSNTITNIANASLTNSSMTLAGHSVSLGGTQTFAIGDLSTIGATTIVGNNTGVAGVPLALTTTQIKTMLGEGTLASQNANALNVTGVITLTGLPGCLVASDACPKSYIDSAVVGSVLHPQVAAATPGTVLPNTPVASGTGPGKTLTSATNTALVTDGYTVLLGDRVLVKDQANAADDGIFKETQLGTGSVPWILTRATDFDTAVSGEVALGAYVFVANGTVNVGTQWQLGAPTPASITVDTTALTFNKLNASSTLTADGTTIQNIGGTISVLQNGVLNAVTATPNSLIARGASTWAGVAPVNNAVLVTSAAGVPSESTTLPSGLTIPGYLTANQTITLSGATTGSGTTAITTALASVADATLLSNISGGLAAPSANTLSAVIDHDITATANSLLARGASTWAGVAPVNNAVLVTSAVGVPSESTTLPSGLTIPGYLTANQTITLSGATTGSGTTAITTSLASAADATLLSNISGGLAAPSANTLTAIIDHDITATANSLLARGASTWGSVAPVNNAVLSTNGTGVPSESTTLPSGLTIPGYLTGNQTITISGDATGSGATSITLANTKVNGVNYPAAPATNTIPYISSANQASYGNAATILTLLGAPFSVPNGGWGLTTLTSGAIYKGNGASAPTVSGLSDNGTIVSTSEPLDLTSKSAVIEVPNAGTGGTTAGLIAKLSGAPSAALTTLTTDTDGAVGIVIGGGGTTGNAQIAVEGQSACTFDSGTTAGHFVTISGSVPGNCHDGGASRPAGVQSIGQVLSSNGVGGSYQVQINLGFTNSANIGGAVSSAGTSTVNNIPFWTGTDTLSNTGVPFGTVGNNTLVETGAGGTITNSLISALPLANLATISDATVLSNVSGALAVPSANTLTAIIDHDISATVGAIPVRGASTWGGINPVATVGFVLTNNGVGVAPTYQALPAPVISGMTVGQVPVAATATTITSSIPFGTIGNNTLVETSGGGTIANALISGLPLANLATMADATILSNVSGIGAVPSANTLTSIISHDISSTRGALLENGAAGWTGLNPSATVGFVLTSNGTGADPTYQAPASGGISGLTSGQLAIAGSASTLTSSIAFSNVSSANKIGQLNASGLWDPGMLPLATAAAFGAVKCGANTTCTGGVISAGAGSSGDTGTTGITAAGATLAAATDLTTQQNYVSSGANCTPAQFQNGCIGTAAVRFDSALMVAFNHLSVCNEDPTNALLVYPDTIGHTINNQGAGVGIPVNANQCLLFFVKSSTALRTAGGG